MRQQVRVKAAQCYSSFCLLGFAFCLFTVNLPVGTFQNKVGGEKVEFCFSERKLLD